MLTRTFDVYVTGGCGCHLSGLSSLDMSNSDSKMTSVGDISGGMVIKTEPGVINTGRLSSFKQPRDLMLNNITSNKQQPKKVFTPNLNAVRNKNKQ